MQPRVAAVALTGRLLDTYAIVCAVARVAALLRRIVPPVDIQTMRSLVVTRRPQ
jgi:hypothetical protein